MDTSKYFVEERKYAIRFIFMSRFDARDFRLPSEYKEKFELNNNMDQDGSNFIRIAQVKLN